MTAAPTSTAAPVPVDVAAPPEAPVPTMRFLPCADVGVLVELESLAYVLALHEALAGDLPTAWSTWSRPPARCCCTSTPAAPACRR
ncbi:MULTISPECIES: hypothetical protein [unclassified Nocardioides]|uniref:hypothetical protein n=1 Tax=unclassified Nocardioides TaxID=2615069 RepID=UPI001EE3C27E|nr:MULTISPECIES: hypothetical protein [unclassified Nocardioides]